MAIPEAQLETWSHQGAIAGSSNTYNAIKAVLEANTTPYANRDYSVFLQGSYGNDTNIYAESDVDIIICLNATFQSDKSALKADEITALNEAYKDAVYTHAEFKKDVLKVLSGKYVGDVTDGKKAIMIASNGTRRKADVIVAIEYRRYYKFNGTNNESYDKGICFYTTDGMRVANYPKQHRENLTVKHQASSGWLKPMVRVMKNLRTKLVNDGLLNDGIAPSYFIEGLLYNVPSDKFHTNHETCFVNAFNWIRSEVDKSKLVCANEQYYLLRDGVATCWPNADCAAYLDAVGKIWKEW